MNNFCCGLILRVKNNLLSIILFTILFWNEYNDQNITKNKILLFICHHLATSVPLGHAMYNKVYVHLPTEIVSDTGESLISCGGGYASGDT